jgi:hypothetical protein
MQTNENVGTKLDDRMTDECKVYVTNFLKVMKPADLVKIDLNLARKSKDLAALDLNKHFNFDSLDISEFFVKNPDDDFDIPVTIFRIKFKSFIYYF